MNSILARMNEPSTWAGIAGMVAIFGPQYAIAIPFVAKLVGGIAGLAAIFFPEKSAAPAPAAPTA